MIGLLEAASPDVFCLQSTKRGGLEYSYLMTIAVFFVFFLMFDAKTRAYRQRPTSKARKVHVYCSMIVVKWRLYFFSYGSIHVLLKASTA